jgi:hypothetical protein
VSTNCRAESLSPTRRKLKRHNRQCHSCQEPNSTWHGLEHAANLLQILDIAGFRLAGYFVKPMHGRCFKARFIRLFFKKHDIDFDLHRERAALDPALSFFPSLYHQLDFIAVKYREQSVRRNFSGSITAQLSAAPIIPHRKPTCNDLFEARTAKTGSGLNSGASYEAGQDYATTTPSQAAWPFVVARRS